MVMNLRTFFFFLPEGGALWPAQLLGVSQELAVLLEGPCAFHLAGGREKASGLGEALPWSQRGHMVRAGRSGICSQLLGSGPRLQQERGLGTIFPQAGWEETSSSWFLKSHQAAMLVRTAVYPRLAKMVGTAASRHLLYRTWTAGGLKKMESMKSGCFRLSELRAPWRRQSAGEEPVTGRRP